MDPGLWGLGEHGDYGTMLVGGHRLGTYGSRGDVVETRLGLTGDYGDPGAVGRHGGTYERYTRGHRDSGRHTGGIPAGAAPGLHKGAIEPQWGRGGERNFHPKLFP